MSTASGEKRLRCCIHRIASIDTILSGSLSISRARRQMRPLDFLDEAKSGPRTLMIASMHRTRDAKVGHSNAAFDNEETTSSVSKISERISRETAPRQLDTCGEKLRPDEVIVFSMASSAQKWTVGCGSFARESNSPNTVRR